MYLLGIATLAVIVFTWPLLWHPSVDRREGSHTIASACWSVLKHKHNNRPAPRPLHGYFLHITDMHVDADYKPGATIKSACHTLPVTPLSNGQDALPYGTPGKKCDAPLELVHATLDWIQRAWGDKIDFVVWTGDNARHDWDKRNRRSRPQVYSLNKQITNLMNDMLGDVPLIPSLGNNDIHPHNKVRANDDALKVYEQMWRRWIPATDRATFQAGGYFSTDVASGLRILSLNTMYFFKRNKVVQSCSHADSPGAIHLVWLTEQLEQAKADRIAVFIVGHVPPSPRDYKATCLNEYRRITAKYSNVVTGQFFGHLNMDHFLLFDGSPENDLDLRPTPPPGDDDDDDDNDNLLASDIHVERNIAEYVDWLRYMYLSINPNDASFNEPVDVPPPVVAIQVTPSILPIYFPAIRIYQYEQGLGSKPFGTLLGYEQYYANITEWSLDGPHDYQLEYTTKEAYGLEDLSAESFFALAKRMTLGDQLGDRLWGDYVRNMFVQSRNHTLC